MSETRLDTALHQYVEVNDTYYRIYERYQPNTDGLAALNAARPAAHVVAVSRYTCPDCARNVPRMARIAEHLPGWTWEIFDGQAEPERKAALNIIRVPTFIVYDAPGGRELGRIVENPITGSLVDDLLQIAGAL